MQLQTSVNSGGMSWLGFELNILRRLKFKSAALPLAGEPHLGNYLKRWDVRVVANDPAQWAWTKSVAFVENNSEVLTERDVELVLADAYVPGNFFKNASLVSWGDVVYAIEEMGFALRFIFSEENEARALRKLIDRMVQQSFDTAATLS